MSYLYEINNISKIYGSGSGATEALKGVNLTIEEGKLTAILGPSGSGKSTLLNILGALDKPTSGQVLFLGEDISHYSSKKLAKFRRENIVRNRENNPISNLYFLLCFSISVENPK